jgi:CHAT domain-containing protein
LAQPLSKAAALQEAKEWLRELDGVAVERALDSLSRGARETRSGAAPVSGRPFGHPHYWAGFILMGDPD